MENLEKLNNLSKEEAKSELLKCCGSEKWSEKVAEGRPYSSKELLFNYSDKVWSEASNEDIFEAFSHHPKIGDLESLTKKFSSTKDWASGEQSGVNVATQEVLQALATGNLAYEEKFGYIFIVCATGKSASEMFSILQERLKNEPETEIKVAANEQNKITHIRLEKLLNS